MNYNLVAYDIMSLLFYVQALNEINVKNLAEGQSLGWFSKEKIKRLKKTPDIIIFEPNNLEHIKWASTHY